MVLGLVIPLSLLMALAAPATARPTASSVGTLRVERHGYQGPAVILIPGLQGGPWVWKQTIENLSTHNKIDQPVLVGHSLGGTLALRFAGEHPELIAGVVAVDGLPIFPGMERVGAEQRQVRATRLQKRMATATPEQSRAQALQYMQRIGLVDQRLAATYAPMNARSDIKASAQYMAEDLAFDGRAGLKNANVPILEISPYYAPDFSQPPMVMSEAQKAAYYQSLLANAPDATVVSISPSRHFVMLDQPARFEQVLDRFLARVAAPR